MAHRDNSLRCGFWSLSRPNSGLWPAERPEDLWVHGIARIALRYAFYGNLDQRLSPIIGMRHALV
jgi:hypothetical protein